jgi:hypothetical protein
MLMLLRFLKFSSPQYPLCGPERHNLMVDRLLWISVVLQLAQRFLASQGHRSRLQR